MDKQRRCPSCEGGSAPIPPPAYEGAAAGIPSGSASRMRPSAYRTEQNRLLRRKLLGRMAVLLLVWTAVFCLAAFAFNRVAVPRIADAVADEYAPWVYVSPENAGTADWAEFDYLAQKTREDTVTGYICDLYGSSDGPQSPREGASSEALALADGVREQYPLIDAEEVQASSDDGSYALYEVSDDARKAVEDAVERLAADDKDFEAISREALAYYGLTESTCAINGLGGYYERYYLDGHFEYRNMAVYDMVRSFKVPLAVAVYLIGVAGAVWLVVRRSLRAFDTLFGAMENVLLKRDAEPDLPAELEPTSRALDAIRRENEGNEMAARAAEQRKNELVAYLAHDIRTPLTSVVGYLTMLQESPEMPVEQRARYAGIALDRAQRLEGMLEEFFEITRYNLQSIPIERERFDAGILCRQVADEFFPSAEARGIVIEVEAEQPMQVFADAGKVSRVLNNLLKNAVSYADEGSTVYVRARLEDRFGRGAGADGRVLAIDVENRGREISPAHLQSIFEKFYREDSSRSTNGGGAGLGLAIAREIARAHGGDLTAQSSEGRTVFSLAIPA